MTDEKQKPVDILYQIKLRDVTDLLDEHYPLSQESPLEALYIASQNLSDLRVMAVLKRERYSGQEVDAAIDAKRIEIHNTPHPLEDSDLFADCRGDPEFREWCAAGYDPMYYPGPIGKLPNNFLN